MSNQLILVLNCGSSSLKGAVIDRKNGKVLLSCLGERLGTPEAVITFSKDGKKCQTALTGRNDHAGAVGMLLKELEKHGLHDRIKAIGHRIAHGGEKIQRICFDRSSSNGRTQYLHSARSAA